MKAEHTIRRFLLLAALSIFSPTPAEAVGGYAIDLDICNPTQQLFLEAQLQRASTIGKFVSLNLGSNMSNRQGWYLNGYIMNFVTLLMGNAQDAYVFSRATIPYCVGHTARFASHTSRKLNLKVLLPRLVARFASDPKRLADALIQTLLCSMGIRRSIGIVNDRDRRIRGESNRPSGCWAV